VVPFLKTFTEGAQGTIPRGKLDAMLADPGELSGVLNKALLALRSLRAHGFSDCRSTREATEEFRRTTDPLMVWLDTETELLPLALVVQDKIWQAYNRACGAAGRPTLSKTAFGRAIARARPTVEKAQRVVNGILSRCYVGIGMLSRDVK
jgi:phage/plasmid-associated DNA primase